MSSMKANVDIVLDCAEPERLAAFWQEAIDDRLLESHGAYVVLVAREGTRHHWSASAFLSRSR